MKWHFFRMVALFSLMAGALLTAGTYWLWTNPMASVLTRPIVSWSPPSLPGGSAKALSSVSVTAEIALQRPIFSPTRRPFVAAVQEIVPEPVPEQPVSELPVAEQPVAEPLSPAPQFSLKGIWISPARSTAFLVTPELPAGQWLAVGDDFAGWKLKAIENNAVTLTFGEQSATVQLYVDNPQNGLGTVLPTR
jgi:hypothetical protein